MTVPLPKKILIIEDDVAIRRLLEVCLRAIPAEQIVLGESREALAVLRREPIGVVVTDVMMPQTSGFDIVRAMRSDPALRGIPVIMLSAMGNPSLPAEATEAGVQAYFPKPFSPSQLIAETRRLLAG